MKPINFEGAILKKSDNYKSEVFNNMDLPVFESEAEGEKLSQSIWEVSDEDLKNINETKKVVLTVWGHEYPPVGLHTAPESEFNIKKINE